MLGSRILLSVIKAEKNSKANIYFLGILCFKPLETLKKMFDFSENFSGITFQQWLFLFSLYDFGYRVNNFHAGKLLFTSKPGYLKYLTARWDC